MLRHIPGKLNIEADFLSRILPLPMLPTPLLKNLDAQWAEPSDSSGDSQSVSSSPYSFQFLLTLVCFFFHTTPDARAADSKRL